MKRLSYAIGLIALISLGSCRQPQLEREDVPLMWGIRFEGEDAASWINPNLDYGAKEWMIEIPIHADSLLLPTIPNLPFEPLVAGLKRAQISYNLAFTTVSEGELFPPEFTQVNKAWFTQLEKEVISMVGRMPYPPKRIVLGNDWQATESASEEWRTTIHALQAKIQTLVGYGWRGDRTTTPDWLEECDFFALEYPPLAESDPRPFAVQNNPKMAICADSLQLPLFIYRGNLMGKDRVPGMKNRLRFWPPTVPLEGFVANSMYPKLPPLDSSSYFGVMTDTAFLKYWSAYQKSD